MSSSDLDDIFGGPPPATTARIPVAPPVTTKEKALAAASLVRTLVCASVGRAVRCDARAVLAWLAGACAVHALLHRDGSHAWVVVVCAMSAAVAATCL